MIRSLVRIPAAGRERIGGRGVGFYLEPSALPILDEDVPAPPSWPLRVTLRPNGPVFDVAGARSIYVAEPFETFDIKPLAEGAGAADWQVVTFETHSERIDHHRPLRYVRPAEAIDVSTPSAIPAAPADPRIWLTNPGLTGIIWEFTGAAQVLEVWYADVMGVMYATGETIDTAVEPVATRSIDGGGPWQGIGLRAPLAGSNVKTSLIYEV